MNADEYRMVSDFEGSLTIGTQVTVRWTNSGYGYNARGTVCKINEKSLRVTLDHDVAHATDLAGSGRKPGYPKGRELLIPRVNNFDNWSLNNRVEPVDGYPALGPSSRPVVIQKESGG